MEYLRRLFDWIREPWLTESRALSELSVIWPDFPVRIQARYGRVKIYRGHMLMTNLPTLKRAMDRIRKYSKKSA
jgi:hypothetical protein